ncbi:hypothetical protein Clacol_002893 [Clathrus columnatus]|uniref:Amino acid transporter n=1 Tax=Clathrus columnatus TaxID=1419009 RepID=A0AAV5A613_9AGAM|nr:hypothetical protein Clacol_002893 [Clathrus columnatus]
MTSDGHNALKEKNSSLLSKSIEITAKDIELESDAQSNTWNDQKDMESVSSFGLVNGGTAGLIYMYITTWFGFTCLIASMAEMASMAPTTGGQYHWVSEFAPKSWVSVLAWQTGVTSIAFLVASQIQSLLVVLDSHYVFEQWHATLLIIAVAFLAVIFNTILVKRLPLVETIALILHIAGFFVILISLWVLAPRNSAKVVFTQFTDGGGWGNIGLSTLIGILSPIFAFVGPDSAAHLSEEIRDASLVLPRAMMATTFLNGLLGFIMLVTFCFCLGDIDTILANPEVQPYVLVLKNVTKSNAGTALLSTILIVLTFCGCISNMATASRQLFAFARDNGVPFAPFLSQVRPGLDIPVNAVLVSFSITALLSLINIGSTVAFNAIASLGTAALLSSYIICILCVRLKRWRNEPLPPARWSLGKYGGLINDLAVAYLVLVFVLTFFPMTKIVTPANFNWNVLIYVFTLIFSVAFFFVKGRRIYVGPVMLIKNDVVDSPVDIVKA